MKAQIEKTASMTRGELHALLMTLIKNEFGFEPTDLSFPDSGAEDDRIIVFARRIDQLPPTSRYNPTGPAPK